LKQREFTEEFKRETHGMLPSMSGKGNCYDNAMVETVFKTIKSKLIWRTVFQTRIDAIKAIGQNIDGLYIIPSADIPHCDINRQSHMR